MNKAASLPAALFLLLGVLSAQAQDNASKGPPRTMPFSAGKDPFADRTDNNPIESTRMAYASLKEAIPGLVKRFDCAGKNVVLYGPGQADSLVWLRTFGGQLELVRTRLKLLLDSPAPALPDPAAAVAVPAPPAVLAGPARQALLDLGSLLSAAGPARRDLDSDEGGLIPIVAQAAVANGCSVYWPDGAAPNLYNRASKLMVLLNEVGDMTDNGQAAGKPLDLQQKLRALQAELQRAEAMAQDLGEKIENEQSRLSGADKSVQQMREQIDWLAGHIETGKDTATQAKLNKTFSKSWDDLEAATARQMSHALPQSMEDQEKVGELAKRVDVLRTQTEFLSKYTRDERDLALQEKLKRTLSQSFDDLAAAIRNRDALAASVPKGIETDLKEKHRWEAHAAGVKAHIEALSAVLESYSAVRKTLLNSESGASPLHELLRAESLRDLILDENFGERPGASIVHLKLERIAGTSRSTLGNNARAGFSGGVVLSFVQYDPNGKVMNSGVETAYSGFRSEIE